jgi:hypothetical protein
VAKLFIPVPPRNSIVPVCLSERSFWLIVDSWDGRLAYRSADLSNWRSAGRILDGGGAAYSSREGDVDPGFHSEAVVDGVRALIVYFTLPQVDPSTAGFHLARRSSVLSAELEINGDHLACDRSRELSLKLSDQAV